MYYGRDKYLMLHALRSGALIGLGRLAAALCNVTLRTLDRMKNDDRLYQCSDP